MPIDDNGIRIILFIYLFVLLQRERASEAKELAKYERKGYGGVSSFQSTWPLWLHFWMFLLTNHTRHEDTSFSPVLSWSICFHSMLHAQVDNILACIIPHVCVEVKWMLIKCLHFIHFCRTWLEWCGCNCRPEHICAKIQWPIIIAQKTTTKNEKTENNKKILWCICISYVLSNVHFSLSFKQITIRINCHCAYGNSRIM